MAAETRSKFKTWKTLYLGNGLKATDNFNDVLTRKGFKIDSWTAELDVLTKPVSIKKIRIDLFKVTVSQLGFEKGARRNEIFDQAETLGLKLCPAVLAPQLRSHYTNQPNNEHLMMAMTPILDPDGNLQLFVLICDGHDLWLSSYRSNPVQFWGPDSCWVFCRSRKRFPFDY